MHDAWIGCTRVELPRVPLTARGTRFAHRFKAGSRVCNQAVVKSPRSFGKAVAEGGVSFAKNTVRLCMFRSATAWPEDIHLSRSYAQHHYHPPPQVFAPINTIGKLAGAMERSTDLALRGLDMETVGSSQVATRCTHPSRTQQTRDS